MDNTANPPLANYDSDLFFFTVFLDPHPDLHYKPGSSSEEDCHRGHGSSGYFGADGTNCDAPMALIDATLRWIEQNLKGDIDFVLWTGDSARHDKDERIPRTMDEIVRLNEMVTQKFIDIFQQRFSGGPSIPIVPTFGNNDIMPHNTMKAGPNRWTREFLNVWNKLIPEPQRHSFVEGGWFTTEVIPNKLAVISLNTMYFYSSNSAVDGCEVKSEPGYEHMQWLKVQLKLLRQRQMKAILIGHVAPARAGSKQAWDETCWQKYTLWLHQYRDVVIGSVYGHMNTDHFMLQDSNDVDIVRLANSNPTSNGISVQSDADYIKSLRDEWSKMPPPPSGFLSDEVSFENTAKSEKKKWKRFLKKIGGPLAEKYSVSLVSPSLVPNYFPTIRVIEYNITGLEDTPTWADAFSSEELPQVGFDGSPMEEIDKKKKKKKKPNFKVPDSPPSSALPGPAYSNQQLSWLSYTQYYANLTKIHEQIASSPGNETNNVNETNVGDVFNFEVEYDTRDDHVYNMKDLTVRSFFDLALRIGGYRPRSQNTSTAASAGTDGDGFDTQKKKRKKNNKTWRTFFDRAFVGYLDIDDLDES